MADKLTTAINERAKAQQYLFNLEKLKEEGSIENIHYETLKNEYTRMLQEAQSKIDDEKSQVKKVLDKHKQELAAIKLDLKYLEIRYKVGELSLDTYTKKEGQPSKKIAELENTIAQLEQVINAPEAAPTIASTVKPEPKKSSGFSLGFGKKKEETPETTTPPVNEKPVDEEPVATAIPVEEQVNTSPPEPVKSPENTVVEAPTKQPAKQLPPGLVITGLDILPNRVAAGNHVGIVASLKNNSDDLIQHRIELKTNEEVKKEPDFDNKTVENSRGNTSFLNDIWEKILEEINRQKQSVGTFLRKARIKEGDGNSLLLEFSKENMFYLKGVEKNSQMILKAIEKIAGKKYRLKCILNEGISTNAFLSEKQEEIIEVDPQVQKVLDIFKGKIINRVN